MAERREEQQKQNPARVRQIKISRHEGPLPSPEDLEKYDQIIPNGAERIMATVEIEQGHRHVQEKRYLSAFLFRASMTQFLAFAIVLSGMYFGYDLLKTGQDVAGFTTFLSALGAVVAITIRGKVKK